jgi:cytochrome c oxidase assembly protein Cox11
MRPSSSSTRSFLASISSPPLHPATAARSSLPTFLSSYSSYSLTHLCRPFSCRLDATRIGMSPIMPSNHLRMMSSSSSTAPMSLPSLSIPTLLRSRLAYKVNKNGIANSGSMLSHKGNGVWSANIHCQRSFVRSSSSTPSSTPPLPSSPSPSPPPSSSPQSNSRGNEEKQNSNSSSSGNKGSGSSSGGDNAERRAANRRTAKYVAMVVIGLVGATYLIVPLYRLFCQITGYAGTTKRTTRTAGHGKALQDTNVLIEDKLEQLLQFQDKFALNADKRRELTIIFTSDVDPSCPWQFFPSQHKMRLRVGDNALAFYTAKNMSDKVTFIHSFIHSLTQYHNSSTTAAAAVHHH